MQKSKKQKKAAWVLLADGAGLTAAGLIIVGTEFTSGDGSGFPLGAGLTVGGDLAMISSVPLFILSGRNKRKAASISFNNLMTPEIKNSSLVYHPIPAVSLKISL